MSTTFDTRTGIMAFVRDERGANGEAVEARFECQCSFHDDSFDHAFGTREVTYYRVDTVTRNGQPYPATEEELKQWSTAADDGFTRIMGRHA